ncbi:MAG TPA: hypothetical protein VN660_02065 [Steroidobacteraceae bacterium]|nr:hypothetical protein [Steroidobacteraceae bacterium]
MGLLDSDMTQIDPNAVASAAPNPTITVPPSLLQRIASGLNTFNQGVGAGMNSPLFSLGMGMLSAAQPFSDPGKAIMGARQAQLQNQGLQQQNLMQQLYFQALQDPQMMAAMGSGGLLPQQPAPTGLLPPQAAQTVGSPGQPPGGSAAMPSAPAASGQPPNQLGFPNVNPGQLYQQGVLLSGSMIPQYRERGQAMIKEADALMQNDPRYVTSKAQAASELAQDQYAMQQAQAGGDPVAMQAARMRYLTDSKLVNPAAYNGNVTTFGGLTPQQLGMSTFSPSTGMQTQNGQASLMPGYAGAEQQRAAAQATGEAAGKTINLTDPHSGAQTAVPMDQYLQFMRRFTPQQAASGQAPITQLGPAQQSQLAKTGEESGTYLSQLQDQADAATNTNYSLAQMNAAAKNVMLGPAAPARQWLQNSATALAQMFGVTPPAKELTNYQELDKYANQIAFAATRQMGSREAAQIVHLQMSSNPNKALMPQAFAGLVQSMQAANNYAIAKNTAIQGVATDKASALQAAATWTSKIDPRVWDLSLGPDLASRFAGQIGTTKIATALPVMANDDAIAVMRNLPQSMRAQVLRSLPVNVKQQLLQGLQQGAGATGTY